MPEPYVITKDGIRVEHVVTLAKKADRKLDDAKIKIQIDEILGVNNTARTRRGWNISPVNGATMDYDYAGDTGKDAAMYAYTFQLSVVCATAKARPSLDSEFRTIVNSIAAKSNFRKWKITHVDGKPYVAETAIEETQSGDVGYAPINVPEDFFHYFDHLYGLDPHIRRIHDALQQAIVSTFNNRFNCALIGPPGCGKSDICQSLKRALGEEAVLEFDATATTLAGAQKELGEREELPRVIVIEEIEKAPDVSLSWLLSVTDIRAEIRKRTARGNIIRDVKMFAIATVNDEPTFVTKQFGALASRFTNKIHFTRPSREMFTRILQREIAKVGGDTRWITPTLEYAAAHDMDDPRQVIAYCLCGGNRWFDGSYAKDLDATIGKGGWK